MLPCSLRIKVKLTSDSIGNSNNDKRMTTPVKCESYEGEVFKEFNKPYLCGLITLALLRLSVRRLDSRARFSISTININELPKPNDGYGYDDDGTITESVKTSQQCHRLTTRNIKITIIIRSPRRLGALCRADFNSLCKVLI